ncbi:hypothetical protein ACIPIN_13580 [Pseudomonas sp. NPDC087697]|uniref:hypothetical protein n=1 Tax=Pseudomonas sp. NPDC087697 TaxID=3364447 RepID=UPI00382A5A37
MSRHAIFIPIDNYVQSPDNNFNWNFGGSIIEADRTLFMLHTFPGTGEREWLFTGLTGTPVQGNVFEFGIAVPYIDDDVMERTYTLEDGLSFSHMHSIPILPGAVSFVYADSAELTIRLDPINGTVQGDYKATFRTHRLMPGGTFKLKRTDQ